MSITKIGEMYLKHQRSPFYFHWVNTKLSLFTPCYSMGASILLTAVQNEQEAQSQYDNFRQKG